MPLYEYICTACEHEFDEIQKFSDKPIRKCPECGKLKVEKKVSLSGFQLKGSGWYKDGYAKPSEKKSSDSKDSKDSKPDKKTEGTKDSSSKPSEKKSSSTKNQAA